MTSMADMQYHFGIKMRFYPNDIQKQVIKKSSNASRFFYNYQIGIDKDIYEIKKACPNEDLLDDGWKQWVKKVNKTRSITYCKIKYHFLNDKQIDSCSVGNARRSYQRAWQNYHSGNQKIPTFHAKKKHPYEDRYQTMCNYGKSGKGSVRFLDNKHLQLPKIGRVRLSHVRSLITDKKDFRIGTTTIYKDNMDKYYVSMQLGSDTPFVKPKAKTGGQLGFDLNTSDFLMDSNGNEIANPRFYRKQEQRLARVQRFVSRRGRRNKGRSLKDCKNYQKMRLKQAKIAQHVKQQREYFLHNVSTKLIEKQDLLVGEELRSSNMLRNRHIAKSISDVGWRSFLTMLSYKAELYGKTFITVPPKNTTQTCNDCGYLMKDNEKLTLKDREWTCPNCHAHHIRDLNAAKNILDKGLEALSQE